MRKIVCFYNFTYTNFVCALLITWKQNNCDLLVLQIRIERSSKWCEQFNDVLDKDLH